MQTYTVDQVNRNDFHPLSWFSWFICNCCFSFVQHCKRYKNISSCFFSVTLLVHINFTELKWIKYLLWTVFSVLLHNKRWCEQRYTRDIRITLHYKHPNTRKRASRVEWFVYFIAKKPQNRLVIYCFTYITTYLFP